MIKEKDNKYYWKYNVNLYKNPSILFLLFKIFVIVLFIIWLFSIIISFNDIGFWFDGFKNNIKLFILLTLIIFILCTIGYYIYAFIMCGSYNIIFEMDDNGIKHTEEIKQFNKSKKIGIVTIILSLLNKKKRSIVLGSTIYSRNSIYTNFKKIKNIKYIPKRNLIVLNTTCGQNQVYANEKDLYFIYKYILCKSKLNG